MMVAQFNRGFLLPFRAEILAAGQIVILDAEHSIVRVGMPATEACAIVRDANAKISWTSAWSGKTVTGAAYLSRPRHLVNGHPCAGLSAGAHFGLECLIAGEPLDRLTDDELLDLKASGCIEPGIVPMTVKPDCAEQWMAWRQKEAAARADIQAPAMAD